VLSSLVLHVALCRSLQWTSCCCCSCLGDVHSCPKPNDRCACPSPSSAPFSAALHAATVPFVLHTHYWHQLMACGVCHPWRHCKIASCHRNAAHHPAWTMPVWAACLCMTYVVAAGGIVPAHSPHDFSAAGAAQLDQGGRGTGSQLVTNNSLSTTANIGTAAAH
jgi:hypothetical protein